MLDNVMGTDDWGDYTIPTLDKQDTPDMALRKVAGTLQALMGLIAEYQGEFMVIDFGDLLYPQNERSFPTWDGLISTNKVKLAAKAEELLRDAINPHPDVRRHWERLVAMVKGI